MGAPITILAISSSVAAGHVGLSAIMPTLNACRLEAVALPTVILSNHPGFACCAGTRIAPDTLTSMLDALDANGMLNHIETILTGYLPSAAHVAFAEAAIDRVRDLNPDALYICDPVLGDDPKGLYIDETAALALRNRLITRADIVLPNRFELAWLTGLSVTSGQSAITAVRALKSGRVIAKSVPFGADQMANISIDSETVAHFPVKRLDRIPHGTGDMFSALIAAKMTVERATDTLRHVIARSIGCPHLQIMAGMSSLQAPQTFTPH